MTILHGFEQGKIYNKRIAWANKLDGQTWIPFSKGMTRGWELSCFLKKRVAKVIVEYYT
jgi:hypothetical protein